MTPAVTVLLTSYNRPQYLSRAIQSVLAQTFTDWELLILDDGSDNTAETLQNVERWGDQRITVHVFRPTLVERKATCRYATLINWGAAHTTGEYITYLCDDDWYLPSRLERMVALLETGKDVVYGAQEMWEDGRLFGVRPASAVLANANSRVDQNSVMHTRRAFDAVGGWDDRAMVWRFADAFFWDRLTSAGYLFHPVPLSPTDAKLYHEECIDRRMRRGETPWTIA
jgi:spore maturation protein CgeD